MKKVMVDFFCNNLICSVGIPESIITDNGENLNSHMMKGLGQQLKITHRNSTIYRPHMNVAVEDAKMNMKMILRK